MISTKRMLLIIVSLYLIGCASYTPVGKIISLVDITEEFENDWFFVPAGISPPPDNPEDTMVWLLLSIGYERGLIDKPSAKHDYTSISVKKKRKPFGVYVTIPDAESFEELILKIEEMYPETKDLFKKVNDRQVWYGEHRSFMLNVLDDINNKRVFYDYTEFMKSFDEFHKKLDYIESLEEKKREEEEDREYEARKLAQKLEKEREEKLYRQWWDRTRNYSLAEINELYKENSLKFLDEWRGVKHKVTGKISSIEKHDNSRAIVFYIDKPIELGQNIISIANLVCIVSYDDAISVKSGQTISMEVTVMRDWNGIRSTELMDTIHVPGNLIATCRRPYK